MVGIADTWSVWMRVLYRQEDEQGSSQRVGGSRQDHEIGEKATGSRTTQFKHEAQD